MASDDATPFPDAGGTQGDPLRPSVHESGQDQQAAGEDAGNAADDGPTEDSPRQDDPLRRD